MKTTIYPSLWFNGNARQAADFYCSVFRNSEIMQVSDLAVTFSLGDLKFLGINGGPEFRPNPSISFFVICETKEELDFTWHAFLSEGKVLMPVDKYEWSEKYGWIEDKYGVSWQLTYKMKGYSGPKFSPSLLFTKDSFGKAEEAINFYTSVFDNSKIVDFSKYDQTDEHPAGFVRYARFNIAGQVFHAMESRDHDFSFSEGISFVVDCSTQDEIDYYWEKLSAVPEAEQCGWLKDKFGISWQVVPAILPELLKDPGKSERVIKAFLQMKKFDIEQLVNA